MFYLLRGPVLTDFALWFSSLRLQPTRAVKAPTKEVIKLQLQMHQLECFTLDVYHYMFSKCVSLQLLKTYNSVTSQSLTKLLTTCRPAVATAIQVQVACLKPRHGTRAKIISSF